MINTDLTQLSGLHINAAHTLLTTDSPAEKNTAVHQLYAIYSAITGVTADTNAGAPIALSSGTAISSGAAAHCLLEFARTSAFLRGIDRAITDLKKRFPGERLRILYAGCGPYATLITPLLRLHDPSEFSIDLLDIIPRSLDSVKQLYQSLELTAYINQYLLCDAISYKITNAQTVHLLISETLNAGLKNEPFLAIMQNLVPQLSAGAIVIPQEITVDAMYLGMKEEIQGFADPDTKLKRQQVAKLASFSKTNLQTPSPVTFTVPQIDTIENRLCLMTRIDVYQGETLKEYDCSLTLPMRVKLPGAVPGDKITLRYQTGEKPGFVVD